MKELAAAGEVFQPVLPVPAPLSQADDDPVSHVAPAPDPDAQADAAHQQQRATWARFAASQQPRAQQAPPPVPAPDPVQIAEAALCETREALLHAKLVPLATQPLPIAGILRGSLHPQDEEPDQALEDLAFAKSAYDEAWQALTEARHRHAQRQAAQRQARADAWVAQQHPALAAELARAQETLARVRALPETPDKPRAFNTARYALQQARTLYSQALAMAPVDTNGSTHPLGEETTCDHTWGMFGIRVKTGHSDTPLDCSRTRFTMCPTTERLTVTGSASLI